MSDRERVLELEAALSDLINDCGAGIDVAEALKVLRRSASSNVVSMAEATGDGTLCSPRDALEDVIKDMDTGGPLRHCKKVVILSLEDTDDQYKVSFTQAGMRMSECISLCEIAKCVFKKQMGYIPED